MKSFGVAVVVGLVAVVLLLILLGYTSPGQAEVREQKAAIERQHARELAPLNLAVARVARGSLIVIMGSAAGFALAGSISGASTALAGIPAFVRKLRIWSWLVKPSRKGAMYSALAAPDGHGHITITKPVNEPGAQKVAALSTGLEPDVKLLGGAARAALRNDPNETVMPEPEPERTVSLNDATRVDPRTNPHWLMIGKTGSGKSTAMRHVLTLMAKRYPCEFVICEPNRANWKDSTHAWTVDGIADAVNAVYEEMTRRADILAADPNAEHVMDLPAAKLPYLCLIFAEMDATMDNLSKLDRNRHRVTLVQLRDIARLGRKDGICLFAESQSGLADILDTNIARNFANIFLFNGSQQTAKSFGVSDLVNLPKLPPGVAFSLTHNAEVAFPITPRPELRRSHLYQERQLQLPADAEADGLGEDDQPDSDGVITLEPELELEPQNGRVYGAETAFSATVPTVPVPAQRIESRRMPTPIEAARMRAHYARTHSKTAVCMTFYGYKNDDVWEWVMLALEEKI